MLFCIECDGLIINKPELGYEVCFVIIRTRYFTGLSICRADSSSSATQILTLSEHHRKSPPHYNHPPPPTFVFCFNDTNSFYIESFGSFAEECDVSVFIVFTEDCERHVEVVTALVGLLRSFGCDVHYALELRCKACIQLDPFNWFRRQVGYVLN